MITLAINRSLFSALAVALVAVVVVSAPELCFAQEMPRMSRGLFFTNTPFGSLGWISSVATDDKDSAVAQDFVRDLSQASCFSLPRRDTYWFIINHRSPEYANTAAFFAVEVIGLAAGANNHYLSLQRNENWIGYNGKELPDQAYAQRPQLRMSLDDFIRLHDDLRSGAMTEAKRQEAINNAMGDVWHALPSQGKPGTWDYRDMFASRAHITNDGDASNQISARLMKFTVTGKPNSARPAVFLVYRNDARAFWVDVAGPSLPGVKETEFRIGSSCTGATH